MQHDEKMIAAAIRGDRLALQQLLKLEKEQLYRMAYTYVKTKKMRWISFSKPCFKRLNRSIK